MSAFSVAAGVGFGSLGLVALGIGLLTRSYSRRALMVGLVGLFGVTAACTWMIKIGTGLETIASTKTTPPLTEVEPEPNPPAAPPESPRRPPQGENSPGREEIATLRDELKRLSDELDLERKKMLQADQDLAGARQRIADLEAENHRIRSSVPTNPMQPLTDIGTRANYTWRRLTGPKLVSGMSGDWYHVQLKIDGKPLVFDDRKFSLSASAQASAANSIGDLRDGFLAPMMNAGRTVQLFLRGTADTRQVVGTTDAPSNLQLLVHRTVNGDQHARIPENRTISLPVRNDDLPDLRADWFRQFVKPILDRSISEFGILTNKPQPDATRTVELLVHVSP